MEPQTIHLFGYGLPVTPLGWIAVITAVVTSCMVIVYAICGMLDPIVPQARKKRLSFIFILALTYIILELRFVLQPQILDYEDIYWTVWQLAVFIYFASSIKQVRVETAEHAALCKKPEDEQAKV
jgi:Ca2+/Na+ antiporter